MFTRYRYGFSCDLLRLLYSFAQYVSKVSPVRVIPVRVHKGSCTGWRFPFRYEDLTAVQQQYVCSFTSLLVLIILFKSKTHTAMKTVYINASLSYILYRKERVISVSCKLPPRPTVVLTLILRMKLQVNRVQRLACLPTYA